jgi:pre-mRNA-splicing factor CDC5/CEF1
MCISHRCQIVDVCMLFCYLRGAVQGAAVRKASATAAMRIDALRRDYERTRGEMESQAHRAARLDKKAAILVAGLQQRHTKLTGQLEEVAQQVGCVTPDARKG